MQQSIIFNFIARAIFNGTFIIALCVIVVALFKIKLHKINKAILVSSVNTLLLSGAMIYVLMWLTEIFKAYFWEGDYEQITFTNLFFGSYWWAALALLAKSILLPQILWIRKLRHSFISTIVIISFWLLIDILAVLSYGLSDTFQKFNWKAYAVELVFYALILTGLYYILERRIALQLSDSNIKN
ncbi:hypothetical protein SAMN05216464_12431 [Mucilaginibacter pineti]|uniref:Uncharacterized protein n=1 Tax=Mucilaginibacter pineti TaxID=1391627 RepID=A0A1G7N427_9SPHI|nr:hypothetical protein [Mucilaginibacter pineti]SDF68109.1 hypothetical protein SAMN05216464_12431 [Mucilaginibacter pineti]